MHSINFALPAQYLIFECVGNSFDFDDFTPGQLSVKCGQFDEMPFEIGRSTRNLLIALRWNANDMWACCCCSADIEVWNLVCGFLDDISLNFQMISIDFTRKFCPVVAPQYKLKSIKVSLSVLFHLKILEILFGWMPNYTHSLLLYCGMISNLFRCSCNDSCMRSQSDVFTMNFETEKNEFTHAVQIVAILFRFRRNDLTAPRYERHCGEICPYWTVVLVQKPSSCHSIQNDVRLFTFFEL